MAIVFIKIGSSAVAACSMSNFITPIVRELGCEVSSLTMFVSIEAIAMALTYTTASKILTTQKLGLVMGIATVVELGSVALMATYHDVRLFYISGLLMGIAQSLTGFVAVPIVINMWFRKKTGTVLGITAAVGSAIGIVYSRVSAGIIESVGWRNAYLILAAAGAVLTVPAVFLLMRRPEEVGCKPYGYSENDAAATDPGGWGLTKKQALSSVFVYVAWLACIMYSYSCGVSGYVVTYTTMELGQTISFGSYVSISMSIGMIVSSLALGRINDRLGVGAGLVWGAVTTGLGYSIMLMSRLHPMLTLPAAFVVGLGGSMYTVQCPLLAKKLVGTKNFSEIWSLMMMANSLIGGGLYSTIGLFYDRFGTYRGAFVLAICFYVIACLTGILSLVIKGRDRKGADAAAQ